MGVDVVGTLALEKYMRNFYRFNFIVFSVGLVVLLIYNSNNYSKINSWYHYLALAIILITSGILSLKTEPDLIKEQHFKLLILESPFFYKNVTETQTKTIKGRR